MSDARTQLAEATREEVRFSVPLPPRGLRRNSLTRNNGYAAKLKKDYSEEVFAHFVGWVMNPAPGVISCAVDGANVPYIERKMNEAGLPWEQAEIVYVWHSIQPVDEDNITGNCKSLTDALRCQRKGDGEGRYWLGIIKDDGPGVTIRGSWEKAATRADERVEITITRRGP